MYRNFNVNKCNFFNNKGNKKVKDRLLKHYARTYKNFDKCMACIEDIIVICQKQQNYEIAERVEKLLAELELIKE